MGAVISYGQHTGRRPKLGVAGRFLRRTIVASEFDSPSLSTYARRCCRWPSGTGLSAGSLRRTRCPSHEVAIPVLLGLFLLKSAALAVSIGSGFRGVLFFASRFTERFLAKSLPIPPPISITLHLLPWIMLLSA